MATISKPLDFNEARQAQESGVDSLKDLGAKAAVILKHPQNEQVEMKELLDVTIDSTNDAGKLLGDLKNFRHGLFRNQLTDDYKAISMLGHPSTEFIGKGKARVKLPDGKTVTIAADDLFVYDHFFRISEDGKDLEVNANLDKKTYASTRSEVGNDKVYDALISFLRNVNIPGLMPKEVIVITDSAGFSDDAESKLRAQAGASSDKVELDFKGILTPFPGAKEKDSSLEDRFMALALLGAFNGLGDDVEVDFVNQTVTVSKKVVGEFISELLGLNFDSLYKSEKSPQAFTGPHGVGHRVFVHQGDNEKSVVDNVIWDSASYYTLRREMDRIVSNSDDLSSLTKTNELGVAVPIEIGNLKDEMARTKDLYTSETFRYYTFVEERVGDEVFSKVWLISENKPLSNGAPQEVPVHEYGRMGKVDLRGNQPAGVEQIQKLLDKPATLASLPGGFRALNSSQYLFETTTSEGKKILVVRVPSCNKDTVTAAYGVAQTDEVSGTETPVPIGGDFDIESEQAKAVHLTFDEVMMLNQFYAMMDTQNGQVPKLYITRNSTVDPEYVRNPYTGKVELAFAYRMSFPNEMINGMIAPVIRQLQGNGYPIEIPEGANDNQVVAAATEFFNSQDNLSYWLPGQWKAEVGINPGLHWNWVDLYQYELSEFSDPAAWNNASIEDMREFYEITSDAESWDHWQRDFLDTTYKPLWRPPLSGILPEGVLDTLTQNGPNTTVKFGPTEMTPRRAAFLTVMFLRYKASAEEYGMAGKSLREFQENMSSRLGDRNVMMGSLVGMLTTAIYIWMMMRQTKNIGSVDTKGDGEAGSKILRDVTADVRKKLATEGTTGIIGREVEAETALAYSAPTKGKNSILFTGDPGVGKTTVIDYIAEVIISKDPTRGYLPIYEDAVLMELDVRALKAGAVYHGQLEMRLQSTLSVLKMQKKGERANNWLYKQNPELFDKLLAAFDGDMASLKKKFDPTSTEFEDALKLAAKDLVKEKVSELLARADEAKKQGRKVILFIDEIHLLMEPQFAQILQPLKPPMASGELCLWGATTLEELPAIEADKPFRDRFREIEIREPLYKVILKITNGKVKTEFQAQIERDPYYMGLTVKMNGEFLNEIYELGPNYSDIGGRPRSTNSLADEYVANKVQKWAKLAAPIMAKYKALEAEIQKSSLSTEEKRAALDKNLTDYYQELLDNNLHELNCTAEDLRDYVKDKPIKPLSRTQTEIRRAVDGVNKRIQLGIRLDFRSFCQPKSNDVQAEVSRFDRLKAVLMPVMSILDKQNAVLEPTKQTVACGYIQAIINTGDVTKEQVEALMKLFPELAQNPNFAALHKLLQQAGSAGDQALDINVLPRTVKRIIGMLTAIPSERDKIQPIIYDLLSIYTAIPGETPEVRESRIGRLAREIYDLDGLLQELDPNTMTEDSPYYPAESSAYQSALRGVLDKLGRLTHAHAETANALRKNGGSNDDDGSGSPPVDDSTPPPVDDDAPFDPNFASLPEHVKRVFQKIDGLLRRGGVIPEGRDVLTGIRGAIAEIYAQKRGETESDRAVRLAQADRVLLDYDTAMRLSNEPRTDLTWIDRTRALKMALDHEAEKARAVSSAAPKPTPKKSELIDTKLRTILKGTGIEHGHFVAELGEIFTAKSGDHHTARLAAFEALVDQLASQKTALSRAGDFEKSFYDLIIDGLFKKHGPPGYKNYIKHPKLKAYDEGTNIELDSDEDKKTKRETAVNEALGQLFLDYQLLHSDSFSDGEALPAQRLTILRFLDERQSDSTLCLYLHQQASLAQTMCRTKYAFLPDAEITHFQFRVAYNVALKISQGQSSGVDLTSPDFQDELEALQEKIFKASVEEWKKKYGTTQPVPDLDTSFLNVMATNTTAFVNAVGAVSGKTKSR